MKTLLAACFSIGLLISVQASAQTESLGRQIQALRSSMQSFADHTKDGMNDIEAYLEAMRACAIRGLAYVPGHEESDNQGCFRPIFTVEEDIVSDLCIGTYTEGNRNDCNKCAGGAEGWKLVGSWDNDGGESSGINFSSLSSTEQRTSLHNLVNLCAKRGKADIEVGKKFFSDLCIGTYTNDTNSCDKCEGGAAGWKLVGSWDNDGGETSGINFSSLGSNASRPSLHNLVNLCARIETAGE